MDSFEIKYDNTLDEISKGYSLFWKKYALRRTIIFTVVYAIALGVGIDFAVRDYTNMPGYILIVIGLGMIFSTWTKPYYAKKRLLKTLESFGEERYSAVFSEKKIVIDTEILPDEQTETVAVTSQGVMTVGEDVDIPEEQMIKHEKTNINLRTEKLDSLETEEMFLLFVNKALIYIFPKRCLDGEQKEKLKNYFEDKNI